jgi:transcriptional regulator with XRE-family HTH domain
MKLRTKETGNRNIIGAKIIKMRKEMGMNQKNFMVRLQLMGMDISATSLSRLEGQHRLVQDYEVLVD